MSTGAPNDLPHPTAADLLAYYGQFNGTIALIHGLTEQPVPEHIITNLALLATGLATTSAALTSEFPDPGLADLARSMAAVERTVHVLAETWDGAEEEWKGARVRELVEAWEGAGPDVEMMRRGLGLVLRNGRGGHCEYLLSLCCSGGGGNGLTGLCLQGTV